MNDLLLLLLGLLIGVAVVLIVGAWRRRHATTLAQSVREEAQQDKDRELAATLEQIRTAFAALSREALSSNTDDFLKLAETRLTRQTVEGEQSLEGKKKLIDARLEEMNTRLTTLNELIQTLEKQRAEAHGVLTGHLEKATQVTCQLHETTSQLREALASPQRRGQWGERMAEDVLRLAGFVEGINYLKQHQVADGNRPDFTFLMPGNRQVHMDVKFPLDNYLKMLDAPDETARQARTSQFLKDVRLRIKEVTSRTYIDPAGGTVDYVLVFIPNEQVYGFIHEHDHTLLDNALRSKVVLCSPMTLYAMLAVIRQGLESVRLENNARQVLDLLAAFKNQWSKYVEGMEGMGKKLEAAMNEYQQLLGVRTRQLDRQLDKVEDLRTVRAEPASRPLSSNLESESNLEKPVGWDA